MKLRYVLPVAVLALALAFGGGTADAVFDNNTLMDNSTTINDNSATIIDNSLTDSSTNIADNSTTVADNSTNLGLALDVDVDLNVTSTDIDIADNSNNPWSASVYDGAFDSAIGISQVSVVAGGGNTVSQTVTGINANQVAVGNTGLSIF